MLRRRKNEERGAAAVEFALVSIVLFTLLFGIVQFGIWLWAWQQGSHAAREASRYAAVHPKCPDEIAAKGREALNGAPVESSSVELTGPAPVKVGDPISVEVTAEALDIGFFDFFSPTISKTATSRVENMPSRTVTCP